MLKKMSKQYIHILAWELSKLTFNIEKKNNLFPGAENVHIGHECRVPSSSNAGTRHHFVI